MAPSILSALLFQSTLPCGSDDKPTRNAEHPTIFQSTLPRGSDSRAPSDNGIAADISIHTPSRERPTHYELRKAYIEFQSTLPRGSDLVLLWRYITPSVISIHAPSRERLMLLLRDISAA